MGDPFEKNNSLNLSFWLFVIGCAIVFFSHIWLLSRGTQLTGDEIYYHALTNLFAVGLLVLAWYLQHRPESSAESNLSSELQAVEKRLKKNEWKKPRQMENPNPTPWYERIMHYNGNVQQQQENRFAQELQKRMV